MTSPFATIEKRGLIPKKRFVLRHDRTVFDDRHFPLGHLTQFEILIADDFEFRNIPTARIGHESFLGINLRPCRALSVLEPDCRWVFRFRLPEYGEIIPVTLPEVSIVDCSVILSAILEIDHLILRAKALFSGVVIGVHLRDHDRTGSLGSASRQKEGRRKQRK